LESKLKNVTEELEKQKQMYAGAQDLIKALVHQLQEFELQVSFLKKWNISKYLPLFR
jgi:hypothetical protein